MNGWPRLVAAMVGGSAWTAALWFATGPGVRTPEALRTVIGWLLLPGWFVPPGNRYEVALIADALLYSVIAWLLLALARRGKTRGAASVERL